MSNASIQPINMTLSGTTFLANSEPGNDSNEGISIFSKVPALLQTLSDYLELYQWHSLEEYFPSPEIQSGYPAALADIARNCLEEKPWATFSSIEHWYKETRKKARDSRLNVSILKKEKTRVIFHLTCTNNNLQQ